MPQLNEKPRLGVPTKNPAPNQGHEVCNSTAAIGFRAALHLNAVRSRYTGKERDAESGNDYFGARYYASSMGRFLSPDWSAKIMPVPYASLGDPQTLNLYGYLRNNPLGGVDADGHCGGGPNDPPCDGVKVQVKPDAQPHPMPNTGPITTADGKKQYITGVGTTTTVTFTKDGKPLSGVSVQESPVTTNVVPKGTAKENANPNSVTTSDKGTITDVVMQPMIGSPQPRADFATPDGLAAINDVANGVPVLKQINQNLSFSVTGPNGQPMACSASYSQTLGNANAQGQIVGPVNSSGSNFTYTTTQPVVTQTNP
jgi:RHS repeat-associated protein